MAGHGLKKLLSGWMGRRETAAPVEPASRANFEQTVIRLQQLAQERGFVEVRFPGRLDASYQSLILRVDPLGRYLLIDELFPAQGSVFVAPGDEVEISSMHRGIPVRFHTWVKSVGIDESDGLPAYRLALPDAVEAQQRRAHFRIAIDAESGVRLRIRGRGGEQLLCTVLNLSPGGIGFSCPGNLTDTLRQGPLLRNCVLTIPGSPAIACELEARSFDSRRQPQRHTVVCARLDTLSTSAAKQLEQFVLLTQRLQRRGESAQR